MEVAALLWRMQQRRPVQFNGMLSTAQMPCNRPELGACRRDSVALLCNIAAVQVNIAPACGKQQCRSQNSIVAAEQSGAEWNVAVHGTASCTHIWPLIAARTAFPRKPQRLSPCAPSASAPPPCPSS